VKIVHIISALPIGGAERALFNLVSEDINSKNKHTVISLLDQGFFGKKMINIGVTVIALGIKNPLLSIFSLVKLYRFINNIKPDVIQGWMYQGNLAAWVARTLFYRKSVLVWGVRHSLSDICKETLKMRLTIKLNRALSKNPDAIVYNSIVSKGQHKEYGFCHKNSLLIANGIDTKLFSPSVTISKSVRQQLGIPINNLVVGNFGRFHPMKNHKGFILAAIDLLHLNKDIHFLLTGNDIDFNNIELNKLIPKQFRKSFHLLGACENIPELMKALDVLCVSSQWGEAFPNVIGEAMSTRVLCLSTDIGDSQYIIGDTGIVIPSGDRNSLLCALKDSISMSREDRINLGIGARQRIINLYSVELMTDKFISLYSQLVNNKGK